MTREFFAQVTAGGFLERSIEGVMSPGNSILYAIAGIILVLFLVKSVILEHHWKRYGVTVEQIKRLRKLYYSVAGALLFTMLVSGLFVVFG